MSEAQAVLGAAIDAFMPAIADQARTEIAALRQQFPAANVLVYDNYNALAVGFSSTDKQNGIAFSITLYPRWVSLFFSRGVELDDPDGLLTGTGKSIRHIVLDGGRSVAEARVQSLIAQAMDLLEPPMPVDRKGSIIIKSQSGNKRPRRPTS